MNILKGPVNSPQRAKCPGCGNPNVEEGLVIPMQPVVLNYRFSSSHEAQNVQRRAVQLAQCIQCGLIFNTTFVADSVPYDERYDSNQCCSPTFVSYLDEIADRLVIDHELQGKRVLEVGCGKGAFLKLLCARGLCEGLGFDTTYEGEEIQKNPSIKFSRRYVTAQDIKEPCAAIICRHVIEHIPTIGIFLDELRELALAAGDPVIVLETPSFEWISHNKCFWDIFYEHCNYFTLPCLAYLCGRAGLQVIRHRSTFNGQYQVVELKRCPRIPADIPKPLAGINQNLHAFADRIHSSRTDLEDRLLQSGAESGWAIWGAGAKGVTLVNQLKLPAPLCVVECNPSKQGCVIPGSSVPITSPDSPLLRNVRVILLPNPNYLDEIKLTLCKLGLQTTLITT